MGPIAHFLFTFSFVFLVAGMTGTPMTIPIFVLAIIGGLFPDFDHRKPNFILAAVFTFIFVTVAVFPLVEKTIYADTFTLYLASAFVGLLGIYVLNLIRGEHSVPSMYRQKPITEWTVENYAKVRDSSSLAYTLVFALFAYIVTMSFEIAFFAFIAYGSHRLLDRIAYGTKFGIKYLVPWKRY